MMDDASAARAQVRAQLDTEVELAEQPEAHRQRAPSRLLWSRRPSRDALLRSTGSARSEGSALASALATRRSSRSCRPTDAARYRLRPRACIRSLASRPPASPGKRRRRPRDRDARSDRAAVVSGGRPETAVAQCATGLILPWSVIRWRSSGRVVRQRRTRAVDAGAVCD